MRKGSPVELDEEYVEAISEMSVDEVVRVWNDCLDKLSRKKKIWNKVEESLKIYRMPSINLSSKLYPTSKNGWKDLLDELGYDRVAELLAESPSDYFQIDDWYMFVINDHLMSYGEDEVGIVYPLALFMKALKYKIGEMNDY